MDKSGGNEEGRGKLWNEANDSRLGDRVAQGTIVRVGLGRVVVKEDREYCEKQEYNKTQRLRLGEVLDTCLLAI
jgi:hypothetical protein